jgi:hypothetical protein
MQHKEIYLHNLQLTVAPTFEPKFEAFLKQVMQTQEGMTNLETHVNILSRRIVVTIGNSWMEEPTELVTNLEAPDRMNICRSTSSIKLSKYIEHPHVALGIKVEYSAKIPMKRSSPTPVSYVVGWETFIPDINEEQEFVPVQKMHFFCQQGPGFSNQRDLIWSNEDIQPDQLRVAGVLSIDSRAPSQEETDQFLGLP